ncbi:hypothetical protein [Ruegeria jejuensis]|uniref:hypothetical protein n=1 Tax=Ruegeria jejuensis TaxID=3233338 RepID=UPI00355BE56E
MSNTPPSVYKVIVEAGFVTLYLGALIFIAGWTYADRYFAELGLGISAVDGLEASSFSAYALWVFRDGLLSVLAVLAGLLAAAFLFRRQFGAMSEELLLALAAALAVLSLFGAAYLGAERAKDRAENLFSQNYKSLVRISLVPKADSPLATYLDARPALSANGCLRKIFMDRKNLYAYAGVNDSSRQPILIIPLSEVALIETSVIPDLCTF